MPRYTPERKAQILSLLRPPHNLTLAQVCKKEGIRRTTMYIWLEELAGDSTKWSTNEKFTALVHTANMNPEQLAGYCKKNGITPAILQEWKTAFLQDAPPSEATPAHDSVTVDQKRIAELERELAVKDRALADAMILLASQARSSWEAPRA